MTVWSMAASSRRSRVAIAGGVFSVWYATAGGMAAVSLRGSLSSSATHDGEPSLGTAALGDRSRRIRSCQARTAVMSAAFSARQARARVSSQVRAESCPGWGWGSGNGWWGSHEVRSCSVSLNRLGVLYGRSCATTTLPAGRRQVGCCSVAPTLALEPLDSSR